MRDHRAIQKLEVMLAAQLEAKSYDEALATISALIELSPNNANYVSLGAQVQRSQGDLIGAIESYQQTLGLDPQRREAYEALGKLYVDKALWIEAEQTYRRGLSEFKNDPKLLAGLANVFERKGDKASALRLLDLALQEMPNDPVLLTARGTAYRNSGKTESAIEDYERAQALQPDSIVALNNLAVIRRDRGQYEQAIELFSKALAIDDKRSEIYYNRGNAYADLRRYKEALEDYRLATEKGSNPAYFNNYANALKEINPNKAVEVYTQAIALDPKAPRPYRNRATVYRDLFKYDKALEDYQSAYQIDPDYDYLLGDLLHTKMLVSDWEGFHAQLAELVQRIREGQRMTSPFPLVALIDDPAVQRQAAELYGEDKFAPRDPQRRRPDLKLTKIRRLGFYSADFHNHATMHLMEGMLEELGKRGFELYAFSFGIPKNDPYKSRIQQLFTKVIDVHLKSDQAIGELSRSLDIDIAFDLKGFTQNCRPTVFAERLAPVQINYLGYPGTTGLPYIDYIILDDYLAPPGAEAYFSEKVIRLNKCYQPNNRDRLTPKAGKSRADYGLSDTAFVFASFNNNYKITPDCFSAWMQILRNVPSAILWLFCDNDLAWRNLRTQAEGRGIEPARIVRATRCSAEENLARQRLADLCLDSWPCGGHTTASDAIWMGLPLITMEGKSFCSRVPGSLLTTLGVPSLIASSPEHYIKLATKMATDTGYLMTVRTFFERTNVLNRLYDTKTYTEDFIQKLNSLLSNVTTTP